MFEASRLREFASIEVRKRVCYAHRRILEAIEEGIPEVARRRAEHDIKAYAEILSTAAHAAGDPVDQGSASE